MWKEGFTWDAHARPENGTGHDLPATVSNFQKYGDSFLRKATHYSSSILSYLTRGTHLEESQRVSMATLRISDSMDKIESKYGELIVHMAALVGLEVDRT